MSVNDLMVLRGRVATDVSLHRPLNKDKQAFARFRMVVPRLRRKDNGEWEEGDPLWYTVRAWGVLAENISFSLRKGNPVLVTGKPTAQSWVTSEKLTRTEIAVNAMSIGHDLVFGVASYSKIRRVSKDEEQEGNIDATPEHEAIAEETGGDNLVADMPGEGDDMERDTSEENMVSNVDADGVILDDVQPLAG